MVTARNLLGCLVMLLLVALIKLFTSVNPHFGALVGGIDRRHIVNTGLVPYAAVGKFKGTMTCTAAIVLDPRIIVTAAHCLMERDGTMRRSSFSFQPGYQPGSNDTRFDASVWAVGSSQSPDHETVGAAARDWAILVMDRPPSGVQPLTIGSDSFGVQALPGLHVQLPAYSEDVAGAEVLSADLSCSVHDLVWDTIIHDCMAGRGSSGAPLLLRGEQGYEVVGIHAAAVFENDQHRNDVRFLGGQAIGSWMFANSVRALARQLNTKPTLAVN
ncbi:trypsin-like serine peptidase [Bradyrhizobium sp.]|uniref:trypsin-like serine peptidase n=1 Tax=Bradyrhizobium sp. TaxID=376 RepID=UPI00403831AB